MRSLKQGFYLSPDGLHIIELEQINSIYNIDREIFSIRFSYTGDVWGGLALERTRAMLSAWEYLGE